MSKNILLVAFSMLFLVLSCKKKEDVTPITEKQKIFLGKWQQKEVYNPDGNNVLSPCEVANPTVFEFRSDGKCNISSPNNCVMARESAYALSGDGTIFAIEGVFYYVDVLNNSEFVFYSGANRTGFKQIWKKL